MTAPASTTHVRTSRTGAVETITIDRPDVMNATATQTGQELLAAVRAASADDAVRVIVITGAGRAFSAGADLRDAAAPKLASGRPDLERMLREIFNPVVLALREARKPVVAAVRGPAVGVGCSIALAADLVVAGESAKFIAGFGKVGLSLDGGLSLLLARRIGAARAADAALVGTPIGATDALAWGLVNQVVPDEELPAAAARLAEQLAASAPGALAASKRLLSAVIDDGLAAAARSSALIRRSTRSRT